MSTVHWEINRYLIVNNEIGLSFEFTYQLNNFNTIENNDNIDIIVSKTGLAHVNEQMKKLEVYFNYLIIEILHYHIPIRNVSCTQPTYLDTVNNFKLSIQL